MRWSGVLCVVGLLSAALAVRSASLRAEPPRGLTASPVLPASAGEGGGEACDDFNACTRGDTWRDGHCAGVAIDDGTECSSGCGACFGGECIANPEREGMPCVDDFGAWTGGDVCRSLSGIALCLGEGRSCGRGWDRLDGDCVDDGRADPGRLSS